MAGAAPYDPQEGYATAVQSAVDARLIDTSKQLGLNARQMRLQGLWKRYCTSQYADRKVAWDGGKVWDDQETEQVASAGYLPPGYSDAGGSTMPLRLRKPSAPYHLFRVIVDRFTSLIFSERRHPRLTVEGNPEMEAFVRALAETARLWPAMMKARPYGGAMGTVAVGFQFQKGRPTIQVFDTRWLIPDFVDRFTLKLRRVEQRMMYPVEERDEKGKWVTNLYWFRRVIDSQWDITYLPEPVSDDGEEPVWRESEDATIQHGLGFCPVVWAQNLPVDDDIDGAPDCEGILDDLDALDTILSQVHRGGVASLDPTLVISADGEMGGEIKTGSDNAMKLPANGKASYLELAGSAIDAGLKLAGELRRIALEVAQCVLDGSGPDANDAAKTATEVERRYAGMLAKGSMLREQYGEKLVVPLLQMMIRAAAKLSAPQPLPDNVTALPGGAGVLRGGVKLRGWKGQKTAGLVMVPQVGDGADPDAEVDVGLQWPEFFDVSLADVDQATRSAAVAKAGGLIDDTHAAEFVAPFFHVEDVPAMMQAIAANQQQEDEASMAIASLNAGSANKSAASIAEHSPPPGTQKPKGGSTGAFSG